MGGGYESEDQKTLHLAKKGANARLKGTPANMQEVGRIQQEQLRKGGDFRTMNAHQRHNKIMSDWVHYYGGKNQLGRRDAPQRHLTDQVN